MTSVRGQGAVFECVDPRSQKHTKSGRTEYTEVSFKRQRTANLGLSVCAYILLRVTQKVKKWE